MRKQCKLAILAALAAALGTARAEAAGIQISEWMYNGNGAGSIGEFVELTNMGPAPIDMTGWSFDDNSRAPGSQSLSAFGTVLVGESVILTDQTAAAFRTAWGLAASIKVIGGNTNNLGRDDEINIWDNTNSLIDRLTYNDQGAAPFNGPRTNGTSANPSSAAVLGTNMANQWVSSVNGDAFGSHLNTTVSPNEIGNPGYFQFAPVVPEPSTFVLAGFGLLATALVTVRRRRRKS